jgi:diadenosine tetraphosphatase ApaH/serine/threonine PP2A family protein phosphatase
VRYLVLSDIHANLEALDACLDHAGTRACDQSLVLGDVIGYGADPNAVIERIRALNPIAMVRGNHDKVVFGLEHAEGFNAVARSAARWTLDVLTAENRDWIAALPAGPKVVDELVEICHGSPLDEDAYIFDEVDARLALTATTRLLCLFGHTHYPVTFETVDGAFGCDGPSSLAESCLDLRQGTKYLLNPGSVGQPRDGDPRAAYGIVDTTARCVELYRLGYPIEEAQAKIVAAGLPEVLARRLSAGR